jgi:integrase
VNKLLSHLDGTHGLMLRLMYGTGMRLMECARLRVKDVDFDLGEIIIRDGKGGKDRVTMLPLSLAQPLSEHLGRVRLLHEQDRQAELPGVELPYALDKKQIKGQVFLYQNLSSLYGIIASMRCDNERRDPVAAT